MGRAYEGGRLGIRHKTDLPIEEPEEPRSPSWEVFKTIRMTAQQTCASSALPGRLWKSDLRQKERHVHDLEG